MTYDKVLNMIYIFNFKFFTKGNISYYCAVH